MKRLAVSLAVVAGIATLLGVAVVWNDYLRAPSVQPHPLPPDLISLYTPAGHALLVESEAVADYEELLANFTVQSRNAYCGVASAITVLNAAASTPAPLDQKTLFAHPAVDAHPLKVSFFGMSLRSFGGLLKAHGAKVTVVHASDSDIDAFRREVRSNLSRDGDYLLANYEREHLGQARSGHISPLAAYHAQSDRLLILDVAAHKYPPVWASLEEVWNAMNAPLNRETTTTRGFVILHEAPPAAP